MDQQRALFNRWMIEANGSTSLTDEFVGAAWQAWQAAVSAERVRCAKICEDLPSRSSEYDAATLDCSIAIRKS